MIDPRERRPIAATGLEVTVLGMGTAALGGLYAPVDEAEAQAALDIGFDAGLRFIDTAPFYGYTLSEHRVGTAVRRHGRDQVTLSTKVGRLLRPRTTPQVPDDAWVAPLPFEPRFDYSYDGVMRSFEDSLQRLGTDRIDLLLMHDIGAMTHGADAHPVLMAAAMAGGAQAMRALKDQGAVGAIGLGVNEWEVCAEALEHGDWDVFLLAGRYTLLEQSALDHFFPLCQRRGASIIIGGPFNSGILAGGDTFDYAQAPAAIRDRVAALARICSGHDVPLAAAALQFVLHHPLVASVIPGARSVAEMRGNLDHMARPIPQALWDDLRDAGLLHPQAPI
jgi:D-threo-aldose 1-dehydrogenase